MIHKREHVKKNCVHSYVFFKRERPEIDNCEKKKKKIYLNSGDLHFLSLLNTLIKKKEIK